MCHLPSKDSLMDKPEPWHDFFGILYDEVIELAVRYYSYLLSQELFLLSASMRSRSL